MPKSNTYLARELDLAVPFKAHLTSDDSQVITLVDKYILKLRGTLGSQRFHESKIREQLLILLSNLIWINNKDNQWLYQARGKPYFRHTRYFKRLTKAIFVNQILDGLVTLGFIEQHIGFQSLTKARVTRIRARGSLKRDINKLTSASISLDETREIIHVQVTKKTWFDVSKQKTVKIKEKLDYTDDAKTHEMRENLILINKKIRETFIGLWIKDSDYKKLRSTLRREEKHEINFHEKALIRIFNSTDFALGGRFYHGWWQILPKAYRPYITINHQVVAELDYKHLHPALMYSKVGTSELSPTFDSYTLDFKGFNSKHRNALKLAFQCLINSDSEKSAINAIKAKKLAASFPFGPKELTRRLVEKHASIKGLFFDGDLGKRLQRLDSEIAEYCMLEMLKTHNVLVLPVHDSFIVQQDMINALKEVMSDAYKIFTGSKSQIDEKGFTLWHPFDRLSYDDLEHYCHYKEQSLRFKLQHDKESNPLLTPPDVYPVHLTSTKYVDEL